MLRVHQRQATDGVISTRTHRRITPLWTLGMALVLVAIACGSRVPEDVASGAGAGTSSDDFAPASAIDGTPPPRAAAEPLATGPRSASSAPARRGGASSAAPIAGTGPPALVPGMTDKEITIGVGTAMGFNNAVKAGGLAAITVGDQENQAQALADHLNARGGIAGRKIRLVFADRALSDTTTVAAQKACTAWTEDNRVFAAVSPVAMGEESLYTCLAKKNVIFAAGGEAFDRGFFERFDATYYQPADMNLTRTYVTMVDALKTGGYFGASPKIAVLARDLPNEHRAVEQGLRPALARHGLVLGDAFYASTDANQQSSDYQSAVLRFKSKGITHVLFASLTSPWGFSQAAEPQRYFPRYGLNSRHAPAAVLQITVSPASLRGAMGPGWIPWEDVDEAHDPGPVTPRATECRKIMEDAGENMSTRATALIAGWYCDTFFFLHDAMKKATSYTPEGVRTAVDALASTYQPATTFRSTFGPTRTNDGASVYRLFAYRENCACFVYASGKRPTA